MARISSGPIAEFRGIVDTYFDSVVRLFPHEAGEWGLPGCSDRLGANTAAVHRQWNAIQRGLLQRLEQLPPHAFSGDDWLDRRCLLAHLRTGLFYSETRAAWRTNPQHHTDAAFNVVLLPILRHRGARAKLEAILRVRLAALPDFLAAGLECVRLPVPLWRDLAVESCGGAAAFFNGLKVEYPGIDAALFDGAVRAFERFAAGLRRKKTGLVDGYSVGREAFEFLMRERTGLDWTLNEAEAAGLALVNQLEGELAREARKFGKKPAHEVLAEARAQWKPAGPLLGEYQRVTEEVRRRFVEKDLMSMPPGEQLRVVAVPDFLSNSFPTAAYHQPPPFAKEQTGIFWVNDLSLKAPTAEKALAEQRQHFGMVLTCAHEAYPGHHLQFVVQNRHPSRIRRIFAHAIFYEGWTLWCEKMCLEHGVADDPYAKLGQIHDALWRAHRIVIDCGLHSGKLSLKAARKRLQDGVGFTAGRAQGDLNWYTSAPTVPMSYLLGRLELERVWAGKQRQGWTVKQFNDWALSFGAVPWRWIEAAKS